MKNKIYLFFMVCVIGTSLLIVGCNKKDTNLVENTTHQGAAKKEEPKENRKDFSEVEKEMHQTIDANVYLKRVNDLTMQGLLKFYKVDPNEEVDSKYVLYWDALRQEQNKEYNTTDFDQGQLPVFAHAFDDIQLTSEDIMFPDNIRLKQLVAQKIRRLYSQYMDEDMILTRVDRMNMFGIKPTEAESSQPGFSEEDWYIKGAIERILTEDSGYRITGVISIIKPYAEMYVLHEMAPEKFEGVFKERFGESQPYIKMEDFLELSKYYINGQLRAEEISAYGINEPKESN